MVARGGSSTERGQPVVALLAGSDAPVGFGRGGWALEFQWSEAKLVAVTAWAMRVGKGPAMARWISPVTMATTDGKTAARATPGP